MAIVDSFKTNATTVEFADWPADVTGLERIMLTARGDLQRLLSSFFARTITILPIYTHTSPRTHPASPTHPITQKRQVHLLCNRRTVCIATSTVRITSPHHARLFLDDKFAIGQMFRTVGTPPAFALLECGAGPGAGGERALWRRYSLTMDGFECDIVEVFPDRDMFVRAEWVEEPEEGGAGEAVAEVDGKQQYVAAQMAMQVPITA